MTATTQTEPARAVDGLAPLRAALLAQARAEADRVRGRAVHEAAALVEAARLEVDVQLAEARREGEADAQELLRLERGRLERENRTLLLHAQREAYDELAHAAAGSIRELLGDSTVRERLTGRLRDVLGVDAEIRETDDGGLSAHRPDGSAVDASVRALVERALAGLDLEGLWAPAG